MGRCKTPRYSQPHRVFSTREERWSVILVIIALTIGRCCRRCLYAAAYRPTFMWFAATTPLKRGYRSLIGEMARKCAPMRTVQERSQQFQKEGAQVSLFFPITPPWSFLLSPSFPPISCRSLIPSIHFPPLLCLKWPLKSCWSVVWVSVWFSLTKTKRKMVKNEK